MEPKLKPLFKERMKALLKDESDFEKFEKVIHEKPQRFIRCNTLKISPDKLFKRLRKKWKVSQPFPEWPGIMIVEGKLTNKDNVNDNGSDSRSSKIDSHNSFNNVDNKSNLEPGELGNAVEHLLGYYYVQEISSMLPVLALQPKSGDFVLDLCASPGSKTTQMAACMENKGTIIANDIKLDRVKILSANLERCGVSNVIITRNDGVGLCVRMAERGFKFDKILLDAPCSGEGTLRSSVKTFRMWNLKVVRKLSREQKKLFANAVKCLKKDGEMVYSTCTHSPEENESVVDFALKNFPLEVIKVKLPLLCREGIKEWYGDNYNKDVVKTCRIYPQDNDSEGFFIAKFKLKEEVG